MDAIAERVRAVLKQRDWSPAELSARAGLSKGHVNNILVRGGARTGGETLAAIAKAAGVSLGWLVSGEGDPFTEATPPEAPQAHPDYTATSAPTWSNFPGWEHLVSTALATDPSLAPWAAEKLGTIHPTVLGPITPAVVADLIRFVMRHAQPPTGAPPKKPSARS